MKFNSKSIGVLLAVAAISFTACATKTEVRYVPATDVEVTEAADTQPEATEPEATEPEETDVPFTLPIVPEVTEPELTAPPVINPGYDTNNDWILDNVDYSIVVDVLEDGGFGYLIADQDTTQDFGLAVCTLASLSADKDEFLGGILDSSVGVYTPEEVGALVGTVGALMCSSELERLGF